MHFAPSPMYSWERAGVRALFSENPSQYNIDMPDPRLIQFARELRRQSTDAERRIWSLLRAGKLSDHKFRRQHPIPPYIADYYCYAAKLAVELDGSQHADPEAIIYDKVRTDFLAGQGIHVIRFSDYDALKNSDAVAQTILSEVERRLARRPSHSSPSSPMRTWERGQMRDKCIYSLAHVLMRRGVGGEGLHCRVGDGTRSVPLRNIASQNP